MEMRKLHTYAGNCIHYSPKPGMVFECDRGVDIRAHVGGDDYGWMTRMPCCTTSLSGKKDPQVSCEMRELPTQEQVKADQEAADKWVTAVLNGACPECGAVLKLRENDSVQLQWCPNGCKVSSRGCKRIGGHLE